MQYLLKTAALLMLTFCWGGTAARAATSAGTLVVNVASASWQVKGIVQPPLSAHANFVVAKKIHVDLVWQDSAAVVTPAGSGGTLVFRVTNNGNGSDRFSLELNAGTSAALGFTAKNCKLYLDANGDGRFTPADPQYVPSSNEPHLAAGASETVFAVCHTPSRTVDGSKATEVLKATSTTLSGRNVSKAIKLAGHSSWAVTDSSAGQASASGHYVSVSPAFDFHLAQSVRDPDGGSQVVLGSVITYTLKVTPKGSSSAYKTRVTDPVPDHTHYKPGSLTLDGKSLSDANDADAGRFNAASNQIEVELGRRRPSDSSQFISFQAIVDSITR